MTARKGLSEHEKALLFDAWERANKRITKRQREVMALPNSNWRRDWPVGTAEYFDILGEESR